MTDLSDYYREMIQRADDALAIGIPSVARRILREALIPQATLTVHGEELKTWDQVREEQDAAVQSLEGGPSMFEDETPHD